MSGAVIIGAASGMGRACARRAGYVTGETLSATGGGAFR
jgi:hypothetical protein